jgi:hypothetical protein
VQRIVFLFFDHKSSPNGKINKVLAVTQSHCGTQSARKRVISDSAVSQLPRV